MGVIWAGFPLIVAVILFKYRKDPYSEDFLGFLVEPYRNDVRWHTRVPPSSY